MVYVNVSSSRFHYLFISVAEMKGPYSIFYFEGYKFSFHELLMSFIFPRFSLSRGSHTNLNCVFVSEILLKEIIFDLKQKSFLKNEYARWQDFYGLLNYESTLGTFDAYAGQTFENILT